MNQHNQQYSGHGCRQPEQPITLSNLDILHRLGRGSTSYVFKTKLIHAHHTPHHKQYYAMKVIDKLQPSYSQSALSHELAMHRQLQHVNICRYITHFQDESNHYMLTEYCEKGELTKLLMRGTRVSEAEIVDILGQVGSAIDYLHNKQNMAHGDIKLSNILITAQHYKLCDFGFSIKLDNTNTITSSNTQNNSNDNITGTLMYLAPQILLHSCKLHHKQADIWALGICILTLMLQHNPYKSEYAHLLKNKIINGEYAKPSTDNLPMYSAELVGLVASMLQFYYEDRISIQQLMDAPLLRKYKTNYNNNKNNMKQSTSALILRISQSIVSTRNDEQVHQKQNMSGNIVQKQRSSGLSSSSVQSKPQNQQRSSHQYRHQHRYQHRQQEQQYQNEQKQEQGYKQKQGQKQTQQEQEQNNKTVSNIATDTTTDSIQQSNHVHAHVITTCAQRQKQCTLQKEHNKNINNDNTNMAIWSYCLKPQKHQTATDGYIQIKDNYQIHIKVSAIQYMIESDGSSLTIFKGVKQPKKYSLHNLINTGTNTSTNTNSNGKIVGLYNYAVQLVTILKNKLAVKQHISEGVYYYHYHTNNSSTNTNKCTMAAKIDKIIIEDNGDKQIMEYNIDGMKIVRVIDQGQHKYQTYRDILGQGRRCLGLAQTCL